MYNNISEGGKKKKERKQMPEDLIEARCICFWLLINQDNISFSH